MINLSYNTDTSDIIGGYKPTIQQQQKTTTTTNNTNNDSTTNNDESTTTATTIVAGETSQTTYSQQNIDNYNNNNNNQYQQQQQQQQQDIFDTEMNHMHVQFMNLFKLMFGQSKNIEFINYILEMYNKKNYVVLFKCYYKVIKMSLDKVYVYY